MEFCNQNYIVVLLVLTVFLCDESTTSPCEHQARITIVPEDALIKLNKTSDDGTPEFIVKPGIKTFWLNCEKTEDPVIWKVKLATAHRNSSIETSLIVTTANEIKREPVPRICHTTSLKISNVGENITGLYSCLDLSPSFPIHAEPIFIYGGNASPNSSTIINRGQQIKMDLHDKIFDGDTPLRLPCTTNSPANITVAVNKLTTKPMLKAVDIKEMISQALVQMPARRCGESICIELKKLAKMYGTGQGIQLMCRDGDKNHVRDIVLIKVLIPDFTVQPLDQSKLIKIPFGQKLRFECQSEYPVRLITNYSLAHTITTKKEYLNRQATHRSTLELTYGHPSWIDQWNTMYTSISCERTDRMQFVYSWNYTFVKTQNNETYNTFESQVKLLSLGKCATLDTSLAAVYIVPCSTYTECQMKSPLLYSSNTDYRVETKVSGENFVEFELPVDEPSFMIRCVSFQSDVMTIIYSLKEFNSYKGVLSTVAPMASDLEMHYPLISANVTEKQEVIINETVHLNCTVPVMRYASRSFWTISFRNESEMLIHNDDIMYEEEIIVNGMSTLSTIVKLTSTEVVSLICINYHLTTVQPFVMHEGLFVNNDDVKAETRKRLFPIFVKEKSIDNIRQNDGVKKDNRQFVTISVIGGIFSLTAIITATFLLRSYIQRKIDNQIQEYELKYFLLGRPELISDTQNANSNAQHKAYNESYEIPRKDLHIDYQTCLGSGEFGMVFKAVLQRDTPTTVAVKTVKPGAGASYLRSAMAELKVMLYVQSHENIIKVIGAYTKNLINHELFVVMEYSENGSLLQYLQKNSENFVNQVQNGNLELKLTTTLPEGKFLATTGLIKWANQIANGMKYISSLNVIHGDLAARNILLDAELNIKISDFGLSKKMYEFSQYVRKNSCPVPWRWLAVESINFTEFSCSSDIWAFGVTLWEIFSLGAVPYPGQEFNLEFIKMLTNGYRLPLPEYSTFEIYNIILQCWRKNPQDRPKFDVLNSQFTSMVEAINAHQSSNEKSAKKNSVIQQYLKSSDNYIPKEDTLNDGYVTFNMLDYIDINKF